MKLVPNGVIKIPASLEGNFFRYWFEFLEPLHKLTNREIFVIAEFLKERHKLSKVISDPDVLERFIMNEDSKRKVREACGLSLANFHVIMGKLRKQNVIIDGKINPKYIPNVTKEVEESGNFYLLLAFDLTNNGSKTNNQTSI